MTVEKFERIIAQLNTIKPYCINWGCGTEFGGYGEEREIDGLKVVPLIYDNNVFGFSHKATVYCRTNDLSARTIAKLYAQQGYEQIKEM